MQVVRVQTTVSDDICANFETEYSHKSEFPDYKEPTANSDGSTTLTFPKKADKQAFFLKQAQEHLPFVVVDDRTKSVMAISNGDGKLYKPDGLEFAQGEKMKKDPKYPHDNFQMPPILGGSNPSSGMGSPH